MAKEPSVVQTSMRKRTPLRAGAGGGQVAAPEAERKKPFNPIQFVNEVRAEGRKITWTTWKETWITSVFVAIMVVLTALFFFAVDGALSFAVSNFLKLRLGG